MILFFTHSGAIKFQRKLKCLNKSCILMPVPRALSSNCGIGARIETGEDVLDLVDTEVEKVFLVVEKEFKLIYIQD